MARAGRPRASAANPSSDEALADGSGVERLPIVEDLPDLSPERPPATATGSAPRGERFIVNARDGLRLRTGPGTNFTPLKTLPFGTPVSVIGREDQWAKVDLEGDGAADGFVLFSFLNSAAEGRAPAGTTVPDVTGSVTEEQVAEILGT